MYAYLAKLFVALVFVLHGTAPAATHVIVDNNRIIGGSNATDMDTGFMAYLIIKGPEHSHLCGGSIINEQTILTAAHCIANASASDVKVYAGTKTFSPPDSPLISVEAVHGHPDYDPKTFDNDIALVRLAAPLTFNNSIRAIKLAEAGEPVLDSSEATVFGWGETEMSHESSLLLYTKVWLSDQEVCKLFMHATDRMLCAGNMINFSGSCHGDSGGPLVQADKVIGIVSFGEKVCRSHLAVYSRVAALRSWVDQTLAEHYTENLS